MSDAIDLAEVRRARLNGTGPLACPACQGIWFRVVVALDRSLMVTGTSGHPVCDNCGESVLDV